MAWAVAMADPRGESGGKLIRTVNAGGMELDKLRILMRQSGPHCHTIPVAGTSVGGRARKVCTAVPPSGQHCVFGLDAVQGPIFHVERQHSKTRSAIVAHEQIKAKVFDEVRSVKGQRSSVQGMEHGMTGPISRSGTSVRLSTLAEFEGLSPKRTLVNFAIFGPRKGQPEFFQFQHCLWSLPTHVVYGV